MTYMQWAIVVCYLCFLLSKGARSGSFVILLTWLSYLIFIIPLDGNYYYSAAAGINTVAGVILFKRYAAVAICSFLFIPLNYYGYILWYNYQLPDVYDNISLYLSIIQLLLIIPKGTYSYVARRCRFSSKRPMVRTANFDSRESCAKMHKSIQAKGKNQ